MVADFIFCVAFGGVVLGILALAEGAYYLGRWVYHRWLWLRWFSL